MSDEDPIRNSRRNFIKGLAVKGAIIEVGLGTLFVLDKNLLSGSASKDASQTTSSDTSSGTPVIDPSTNKILKTTDVLENQSKNFVYPRTLEAVISGKTTTTQDLKNTFAQWVVVHLPKSLTAPANLSAVDPISGDSFIALSRVCVHLWCLCDYNPTSELIVCPCHQSEYVPGFGQPYNAPPGAAIAGPASKQPAPNNTLPVLTLSIAQDGSIYASGVIGQVGCGQDCTSPSSSTTATYNSA